jgi:hypothetical protein
MRMKGTFPKLSFVCSRCQERSDPEDHCSNDSGERRLRIIPRCPQEYCYTWSWTKEISVLVSNVLSPALKIGLTPGITRRHIQNCVSLLLILSFKYLFSSRSLISGFWRSQSSCSSIGDTNDGVYTCRQNGWLSWWTASKDFEGMFYVARAKYRTNLHMYERQQWFALRNYSI